MEPPPAAAEALLGDLERRAARERKLMRSLESGEAELAALERDLRVRRGEKRGWAGRPDSPRAS